MNNTTISDTQKTALIRARSGIGYTLALLLVLLFIYSFFSPHSTVRAVDSLTIQYYSWDNCEHPKACWRVYVSNQSDTAIKDIHFKMYYYAKSGTVISTGEETIYEIMNGGEERWFEFEEYLRDQIVDAKVTIDNAKWIDEKGKVYLDW